MRDNLNTLPSPRFIETPPGIHPAAAAVIVQANAVQHSHAGVVAEHHELLNKTETYVKDIHKTDPKKQGPPSKKHPFNQQPNLDKLAGYSEDIDKRLVRNETTQACRV